MLKFYLYTSHQNLMYPQIQDMPLSNFPLVIKEVVLLFVFGILLGIAPNYAQTTDQEVTYIRLGNDVQFGAKGGFLVSDLRGQGLSGNYSRPGFYIGGLVEVPISESFYFQPELFFSVQGTNGDNVDLKFNYLNLPLMGKYHITEEIAAELGPQIAFLIGGNTDDFNLDTNSIDVGLAAGGGYRLNTNLYFQLRVNLGFIRVLGNIDTYTTSFQVGACYFF